MLFSGNAYSHVLLSNVLLDNFAAVQSSIYLNASTENEETKKQNAEKFIDDIAERGIGFLSNDTLSQAEKEREFENLLIKNFDMKTIARFALGRYARGASQEDLQEYYALFQDMIVKTYSERFSDYQGQTLNVSDSQLSGKRDVVVNSFIQDEKGTRVLIQWRVRGEGGNYQVIDIIVEGVSMVITQRSDFASIIQRGGGNISVLTQHIKDRLDSVKTLEVSENK